LVPLEDHDEAEIKRRVKKLLDDLRSKADPDDLVLRPHDVVVTVDSRIAGRLEGEALRLHSLAFGESMAKLADLRSLRLLSAVREEEKIAVLDDPGNLLAHRLDMGKTFRFRVTGAAAGTVYGTDHYTIDSQLAAAAVHAGVVAAGKPGIVTVKLAEKAGYAASVRNGVSSNAYAPQYPGFSFVKGR
ncbi:MAG: hypothetical protein K2W96_20580, partial [Gemmataceae bacterium]|nr:hypothetical protein [Gemmataceae bacterium]